MDKCTEAAPSVYSNADHLANTDTGTTNLFASNAQMPAINQPSQQSPLSLWGRLIHRMQHVREALKEVSHSGAIYFRDLGERMVRSLEYMGIVAKSTLRYTAYGMAAGITAGGLPCIVNPSMAPLAPLFMCAGGSSLATAGAIHGWRAGIQKADEHDAMIEQLRRVEVQPTAPSIELFDDH